MSCYFSACCIASGEPAQIHESISKMKMEIQRKLWISRYEKGALTMAFVHKCALTCTACADPGVLSRGSRLDSLKTAWTMFFCPQVILQLRLKSMFIQQLTFQG